MVIDKKKALGVEEHPSIVLFSGMTCPESHRVRFVLAEKDIMFKVVRVHNVKKPPEDLLAINSRGDVPTLADRKLVLYGPRIITEYLDERFPHPPLMPVEPMQRAHLRLALHHVEQEWYTRLKRVLRSGSSTADRARKELKESILAQFDAFRIKTFFMSDEFSLVDCAVAPLLWRLPSIGVEFPPRKASVIAQYQDRIFARSGFIWSLTAEERQLRF